MKTYRIRNTKEIRLSGRFSPVEKDFPLMWSSSAAEMKIEAQTLEVQIACDYTSMPPYISFTVDGLRSQQFVPVKGKHWYTVFCGRERPRLINYHGAKKNNEYDLSFRRFGHEGRDLFCGKQFIFHPQKKSGALRRRDPREPLGLRCDCGQGALRA